MKQWILIAALGVTATAAAAEQNNMSFNEADLNSDGAITREEAASFAALEQRFDKMDANSNGLIEMQEFGQNQVGAAPMDKSAR